MPATITIERQFVAPGSVRTVGTLTLGSSVTGTVPYAAGGIAVTANEFKLGDTNFNLRLWPTTTGHIASYDKTAKKIKVYTQGITIGATAAGALANGGLALNDAAAEGTARVATTTAADVVKLGPLLELATSVDLTLCPFAFEAIGAY